MDLFNVRIYTLFLLLIGTCPAVVLSTKMIMEAFTDNAQLVVTIRLENSTRTECFVYSERAYTLPIKTDRVTTVTSSEMVKLMDSCSKETRKKRAAILPGTKWCGIGNIANSWSDLGTSREADMCCREHDSCPDYIKPFSFKHGLWNFSFFTKSNCSCDRTFKSCLYKARNGGSNAANLLHQVYFGFLNITCFEQKRVHACTSWQFGLICKQYEYVNKWSFSKA